MQRQQQGEGGEGLRLRQGGRPRLSAAGEALLQGRHPPDDQLRHAVEGRDGGTEGDPGQRLQGLRLPRRHHAQVLKTSCSFNLLSANSFGF